jgi:hypothetical protein
LGAVFHVQLARRVPLALSILVARVSLRMAWRSLSAREWLPIHEAAAGTSWTSLTPRIHALLLLQVRMGGLGFLALSLLLAALRVHLTWQPDPFVGLSVFGIGATCCVGLGVPTWHLHRETGAVTPRRGSFVAAGKLGLADVVSIATR